MRGLLLREGRGEKRGGDESGGSRTEVREGKRRRGKGRGGRRREGRGGLSGNVAEEAFCLKSAPAYPVYFYLLLLTSLPYKKILRKDGKCHGINHEILTVIGNTLR